MLADRIGDNTTVRSAESFSSTAFINDNGKFSSVPLPNQAQIFPVNDVVIADFNKDGQTDVFVAGNMYQREVETTRSDSGKGCMMTFDKEQKIRIISPQQTGISADKDVRDLAIIQNGADKHLVIANNNDALQFYKY